MRNLPARPHINSTLRTLLQHKTQIILTETQGDARQQKAKRIYETARRSKWFQPVVDNLRSLCGEGELCMYCSSNEPSQVEHYRPLTVFPEHAMEYENFLWSCDICNRSKGDRFPPETESGFQILHPLEDDVWEFFFLDEQFGRLIKRLDPASDVPLPRSVSTCDAVGIDRENVQIKRQNRFKSLRRDVRRALDDLNAGRITVNELREEIAALRTAPFQADVADYFLNSTGRTHEPFRSALMAAGENIP